MSAPEIHKLPPQLPKPPRTWLTLLMGGVLLLAGGVIGAGGTVLVVKQRMDQAQDQANNAPAEMSRRITDRMKEELDLTPEQADQIRAAFEEHHSGMQSLWGSLHEDIRAILTPEQFAQWQEMTRRFKRDRRDGGGGGGPRDRDGRDGPPPPPRDFRDQDERHRDPDGPPPDRYRDERRHPDELMRDGQRPPRDDQFRDDRQHPPPPSRDGQFPPPGDQVPPSPPEQGSPPVTPLQQ